jgi:hypothetical protein
MDDSTPNEGLRDRLAKSGEDALGKLAQDLLENPLVSGALSRAFGAREKASQAQEVAFGALNIPSAADIERLTRRVRSVSQRLEGIEDGVDRLDDHIAALSGAATLERRLDAIDERLARLSEQVEALAGALRAAGQSDRPAAAGGRAGGSRPRPSRSGRTASSRSRAAGSGSSGSGSSGSGSPGP